MTPLCISAFELHRLEVPIGRQIGGRECDYNVFVVYALALKTTDGRIGWGMRETQSKGRFAVPAPWILELPPRLALEGDFAENCWPWISGQTPLSALMASLNRPAGPFYRNESVRMALWDLVAQEAEQPLYRVLGAPAGRDRVRAYGSGLDFPLEEDEAVDIYRGFVRCGITAVKVKVGSTEPGRDLRRLKAIRDAVGDEVELAVDANEAWTVREALSRYSEFQEAGLDIAYVEDPLPRGDIKGASHLREMGLRVVGHDYLTKPNEFRRFAEAHALDALRVGGEPTTAQELNALGEEFDLPLIMTNSAVDVGVHIAAALPRIDRIEFSAVWNYLPASPVACVDGHLVAPAGPGHGLAPDPERLVAYRADE